MQKLAPPALLETTSAGVPLSAGGGVTPTRAFRIPLLASFSGYGPGSLRNDISAGLAVAAVGLPSAIAYPVIAGLPPEMGIYASIAPLIAYALFGPSRQLVMGPDAATMTILAAVLVASASAAPAASRPELASILAIGVGVCCFLARALRLGVLANFLSRPILTGFFAGISLSILVGQIGRFTGLKIQADGLIGPVIELFHKLSQVHWLSMLLGVGMLVLLLAARVSRLPVPGPVIVVVLAVILSWVFGLEDRGVAVVGDIPAMLPALTLPHATGLPFATLALGSAAIFLVSFGSGLVTARSFGAKNGQSVDANAELTGFGAANAAAGLFGAFPVSGSDSRTAVNTTVGGSTQLVSIVAAAALVGTVLYLGPVLRILPIPALGAILAATALSLIDFAALRQLWNISRVEFAFALIALWGPIGLGVLNGVVIAIVATLVYLLHKLMYPRHALLGRVPGRPGFFKLHRSANAEPVPGLTICLIQGSLLFFNTDYVKSRILSITDGLQPGMRWLLIDASAVPQIDSSAAAMLIELHGELANRGIRFGVAGLHSEANDMLVCAGTVACLGSDMVFDSLDEADRIFTSYRQGENYG